MKDNDMFRRKVEGQFNIHDRTLIICGVPEYDATPEPNDIPAEIISISFGMNMETMLTQYLHTKRVLNLNVWENY